MEGELVPKYITYEFHRCAYREEHVHKQYSARMCLLRKGMNSRCFYRM